MTEARPAILADAAARNLILNDLDRNFLVEAGAGSGKTTSLVGRMVRLIAAGACEVENIAAVTFTRKAAGELRQRFQEKLEASSEAECDGSVAARLTGAAGRLEGLFIGTIHSFCERLLRERPVEAGLGPEFEVIEGLEERVLMRAAWSEYLMRVRLERPETIDLLDRLDVSPGDLREAYERIVMYPDVELAKGSTSAPDLSQARRELLAFIEFAEPYLPHTEPPKGWDSLQESVRKALRWAKAFNLDDDRYFVRLLEQMNKDARPTLNRWHSAEGAKAVQAAFEQFRSDFLVPALRQWMEYRHGNLIDFLIPAANHYEDVRRSRNMVNLQDLLIRTAGLLRDNPEVRRYFQGKYTRILVDEFQDTDPVQAEIMFYLTGEDTSEKDWTRLNPRAGSLFVVGDPKQSIYRFRRADIDTYELVKRRIEETGGQTLRLTSNFRSVRRVVDWVNGCFGEMFSRSGSPYQAGYTPMDAVRESPGGCLTGVMRLEVEGSRRQEDVVRSDAARISSWIGAALEGGFSLSRTPDETAHGLGPRPVPEDFMILVRFKSNMALYAKALEQRGIPYTIFGDSNIQGSEELRELHILFQCLLDPGNQVFLAAVLRGLFFGIGDNLLYEYKRAGGRFCFLSQVPDGLAGPVKEVFSRAWERLRRFHRWTLDMPASAAFEKIVAETGLIPYALAGEDGRRRSGHVLLALENVIRLERQGVTSFADTVDFLGRFLEEGSEEDLDLDGGNRPGVRIMNLHKAKGLEAPVVILANPSHNPEHEPDMHVSRVSGHPMGFLTIGRSGHYRPVVMARPPRWDEYCVEESKYLEAEAVRLLYVAATRARDVLVVSSCPSRGDRNPWAPLEPYLIDAPVIGPMAAGPGDLEKGPPETGGLPCGPGTALRDACECIEAAIERLKEPGYAVQSVTSSVVDGGIPADPGGRGPGWGNVIHRMMAAASERGCRVTPEGWPGMDGLLDRLMTSYGIQPEARDELISELRGITSSSLWTRALASAERYAEVPFGLADGRTCLTGVIDLVFREGRGWVIVDYKTDTSDGGKRLGPLSGHHGPQVAAYAHWWEHITGEPVIECGMLFTDGCHWVPVSTDVAGGRS